MDKLHWLNPNQPSYIWSIGYGISTQEEFVDRLTAAFPDGDAVIIDIRKQGSGSRNAGDWANWGHPCMGKTVEQSGNVYISKPAFHNPHGNTKKGLALYKEELIVGCRRCHLDELVREIRTEHETKYCLLCCERKPFAGKYTPAWPNRLPGNIGLAKWTGKENCHRVILAYQIYARMHFDYHLEWFTKHLYTG